MSSYRAITTYMRQPTNANAIAMQHALARQHEDEIRSTLTRASLATTCGLLAFAAFRRGRRDPGFQLILALEAKRGQHA